MAGARVIDGKAAAAALRGRVAEAASRLRAETGTPPGLAVILVGEDPASQVYVRNKEAQAAEAGFHSVVRRLPASSSEAEVLAAVRAINADPAVHGLIVQFPVPDQVRQTAILDTLDPAKDVDGLTPLNAGLLASGREALAPCTPTGCIILAKGAMGDLGGAHAVVIGRSLLVGKPVAQLLLAENATVTIAHSRTRDLPALARQADLLIAAVGRPEMVRGDWVKPGACIIDVGINRVAGTEPGRTRLTGDVAFAEAAAVAGWITPVPGGVGPMTIACLLRNTVVAARAQAGLAPDPALAL